MPPAAGQCFPCLPRECRRAHMQQRAACWAPWTNDSLWNTTRTQKCSQNMPGDKMNCSYYMPVRIGSKDRWTPCLCRPFGAMNCARDCANNLTTWPAHTREQMQTLIVECRRHERTHPTTSTPPTILCRHATVQSPIRCGCAVAMSSWIHDDVIASNVYINYLTIKHVRRTETPGKVIMLKAAKCIQV